MPVVEILVGVVGGLLAVGTLGSAVRTVVVPRGEQTFVARQRGALLLGARRAQGAARPAGHRPTDRPVELARQRLLRRRR